MQNCRILGEDARRVSAAGVFLLGMIYGAPALNDGLGLAV